MPFRLISPSWIAPLAVQPVNAKHEYRKRESPSYVLGALILLRRGRLELVLAW
jgi:hypothetical protein